MARGGFRLDNGGRTLTVTVTTSSGGTPTCYTTSTGASTQSLPATISADTSFFFDGPEELTISVKTGGGAEIASSNGGTIPFSVRNGQFSELAPSVDRTEFGAVDGGAYAPSFVFTGTRTSADAAALTTFIETMRTSGKLNGHLHLKNTKLTSAVVLDGGYDHTTFDTGYHWETVTRERLDVTVEDLEVDTTVAVGLTIKGVMGGTLDVNLNGGGASNVVTDASISAAGSVITSVAAFSATPAPAVGMHAVLNGAGPTAGDQVQPLVGTVTAVDATAHTITINDSAGTAVASGGTLRLMTVGVHIEDAFRLEGTVRGKNYAGLCFRMDANTTLKRVRAVTFDGFDFLDCGQGFSIKSVEAFGSLGRIWSFGNAHGDYIGKCADLGWEHYEGGVGQNGATPTKYLWFDRCNSLNGGRISVGDRASVAGVLITGPSTFGRIAAVRVTAYAPGGVQAMTGVQLRDVDNIEIAEANTDSCLIGVEAIGSNAVIGRHHSVTADRVALQIRPSTYKTGPRVDVQCLYDYVSAQGVIIDTGCAGGIVTLRGHLQRLNIDGTAGRYGVDCLSSSLTLDVSGLVVDSSTLTAGVHHANTANLRLTRRASLANGPSTSPLGDSVDASAWSVYQNAGNNVLRIKDVANARDHYTFTPGNGNEAAFTQLNSRIAIAGQVQLMGAVHLYSGSGAPGTPDGVWPTAGDIYFRIDTPTTANQRVYVCTVGGGTPTWVGIV